MPQNKNSSRRPEVMTWGKASPVIATAVVFDLARLFFEWFWFFGPALAAAYCTAKVGNVWVVGKMLTAGCVAVAGAAGIAGIEISAPFGTIMAMAVGLFGFLTLGIGILMTNARIFKTASSSPLWFVGAFAISEVPLVGSLPSFTIVLWRLYHTQIRVETAALKKWEEEQQAEQQAQIEQQTQAAQLQEREAMNAAEYAQAANDAQYDEIPDDEREAA